MHLFNNQVAVVTGASSGIGKAIALALTDQGATVCLVARRLKELEAIVSSSCRVAQCRLLAYQADLAQQTNINQLAARVQEDFGHVDLLIHSAGIFSLGPVSCASLTDFESQLRTNVLGP